MIIGSIYQPPNTDPSDFICRMQNVLVKAQKLTKHLAIGLEHNLDLLKCEQHKPTHTFMEMLYEHNIIPTITKPTRITTSSATLIDNILINVELCENTISGIIEDNISDHFPCFNTIGGLNMAKKLQIEITGRDVRPKQLDALKRKLAENPDLLLPQHRTGTNTQFKEFHDTLLQEINHFLPLRTRWISSTGVRQEESVSSGLLTSIRKCKQLYRKHLRKRYDLNLHQKYKRHNGELKRLKRAAKKLYYENKCSEYKGNTKKASENN